MNYEDALIGLARENPDVAVLTAENRAAIRSLPGELGPQFIDFGIAEQTMVGAAAGLALRGRVPVVHALAAFLTMRAFEFIRTDVALARLPVFLVGSVPGLLSDANGPTHQAIEDVALMRGIPNMTVVCPADETEMVNALPVLIARRAPSYLRFNSTAAVDRRHATFEVGRAEVLRDGTDVTILTYGLLVAEAIVAAAILEARGVSTAVVNLRTLKPVDDEAIARAAARTPLLVTLEDHLVPGALSSITSEIMAGRGLRSRLLTIGLHDRWFRPGLLGDVLRFEGLAGEQIAARIHQETKQHVH